MSRMKPFMFSEAVEFLLRHRLLCHISHGSSHPFVSFLKYDRPQNVVVRTNDTVQKDMGMVLDIADQ